MKKSRKTYAGPSVGSSFGGVVALLAMAGALAFIFYWAQNRIHQVHRDLFNAEAPLSFEVDFANFQIVAKARITSVPRPDSRFKELPYISQAQTFRITHRMGFGSHTGTLELKVSDNAQGSEFLSSDIAVSFNVGISDISLVSPSFKYEAPGFSLVFGNISGSIAGSGTPKFKATELDLNMVNYSFKLKDLDITVPETQKSINLLASKIQFDEVSLDHSKIDFMGGNPFELNLISSFNTQPVEILWSIQKTKILNTPVQVGSGKVKIPVSLLDAFVDPKVNLKLISAESDAKNSGSEKARFLFSAAKDVKRAEAKAMTLRTIAASKNIRREGDFYFIRIDKEHAFKVIERKTQKLVERKSYLDSWTALEKDKMLEEAFYGVVFGDENRALAVKELIKLKETTLKDDPLFLALKVRSDLRDALKNYDEYDPELLDKVTKSILQVTSGSENSKFSTLLRLVLARAKSDKALTFKLFEELKSKETEPQILAMFEFMKYLHVDNAIALKNLEIAREIDPRSLYVQNHLRNRIHIFQHIGDKEKLEVDLKQLMDSTPNPEDILTYSTLLEEKKDLSNALVTIEKCLELNPAHKGCHYKRESLMTMIAQEKIKENPDVAIQYLQDLLVARPSSISGNAGIASLYKIKNDLDKSINHFSIACALGGSMACVEAGDYLSQQGASERASILYDIACDFKSGTGCMKMGLILEKSKDFTRSGEYYERSCNQLQDNVGCYHLARNLQRKQAPNKAIAPYLSKACKLYNSACKLYTVYQTTNMQPDIPDEPE